VVSDQKKSPSDDCLKGCIQFSWPLQFKLRNPNSSRKCAILLKAGLLTPGSSYFLRLPTRLKPNSGISQISFPVTAAGPLPIFTGFPIMPKRHLSQTYTRSGKSMSRLFWGHDPTKGKRIGSFHECVKEPAFLLAACAVLTDHPSMRRVRCGKICFLGKRL